MPWQRTIALWLLLLAPAGLSAQEPLVGPTLPLIVHHADRFVGRQSDSGEVQELLGNVRLQQGNVVISCGAATQYRATGVVLLRHNVRIEQGELRIAAPRISYDPAAGIAVADNGVEIRTGAQSIRARWGAYDIPRRQLLFRRAVRYQDDTLSLWTDTLRYERLTATTYAWGGVYLESSIEQLAAEADTLVYHPAAGLLQLSGSVLLRRWARGKEPRADTLMLSAQSVTLRRRSARTLWASDSVLLLYDTLWAARAESLLWDDSLGRFTLSGAPLVWYGNAELRADSIQGVLSSEQLQQLFCTGQARLRLHTDLPGRSHQLRSDTLLLRQLNDTLAELIASGNARSLYCHRTADAAPDGLFRHSADRIELLFTGDSLRQARWLGAVYGEYVPELLVGERFSAWTLPGMAWVEERPQPMPWRLRPRWLP